LTGAGSAQGVVFTEPLTLQTGRLSGLIATCHYNRQTGEAMSRGIPQLRQIDPTSATNKIEDRLKLSNCRAGTST
jgi:hypothetical protein